MAQAALSREESIGLALAVAAHAALLALIVLRPAAPAQAPPPERIEVTLSEDVAPRSTSPNPRADAAPDIAPEIGEAAPPPEELSPPAPEPKPAPVRKPEVRPVAKPEPAPLPKPAPKPVPKPVAKPAPQPVPKPAPRPVARPVAKPAAKPSPAPAARPSAKPAAKPAATPAAKPSARPTGKPGGTGATASAKPTAKPAGGSRIGSDFLAGVQGAQTTGASRTAPAAVAGPEVKASLLGAISRELKPHWQGKVPEGADSEKLVTVLRWDIARDGSLVGTPQVVRQEGITEANRPQAQRHAEQAIRAVQLAAPFELPPQYFDAWKRVTIRFDKRLSQ